ncbi:hypothetical protein M378DRAFT_430054 [Amanita muscaria Koide BX008]|uniref:Uncharacterized protein n=1 Tax=Amanita muscaria (strain Koide BX008) TaxID=946122 RepID=A0A0C2WWC2_AMAMK|nr:hypothetical protein M378DRAFT_430054 [Amanita muscaria Koide BX008]
MGKVVDAPETSTQKNVKSHGPSNVPPIAGLQRTTAQNVETRIVEAIEQMQIAVSDSYDNVSVFSMYWKSDDTGGAEDSSLFIQTLSKLPNVQTCLRSLSDEERLIPLEAEIGRAASEAGSRKLFILHYAGHAIAGSTSNNLIITPKIGQELGKGPEINMSHIKDGLNDTVSKSLGLDVLLVMDSCCAAIAGRGGKVKGARVELMAATARKGISNSGKDGRTFTQHWCEAFTKLLEIGKPFTCDDIIKDITPRDSELEQFPSMFVLREGWDLPITFCLHPGPIESTLPAAVTSQTVIMAFHVEENPDSRPLKQLIEYLNKAPVPITVLAVLPTSSTLLLLRVPVFLQELLVLPQVAFILTDS